LGNCPDNIDEDKVRHFFGDCGTIVDIRWMRRGDKFKGCGFVEFQETEATDKAVEKSITIDGRLLRVDFANKPPNKKE